MKKVLSVISLAVIIGIACSPKISPDQNWGGQRWVVTELRGVPVQLSSTQKDVSIQFSPSDKRFSGNAGCNRMSGNYTLEKKDRISFGEVISTKMSCDDIAFETAFLAALNQASHFETSNNTLLLKNDREILLKFQARPAD